MKACIICHCEDDHGCSVDEHEICHWSTDDPPVCSRCAGNIDALIARLAHAPCTVTELLEWFGDEEHRDEGKRALLFAIQIGSLEVADDHEQRRAAAPPVPEMKLIGTVADCEIWSPGTYTAGEGWGPVREDLAAAVTAAAAAPKEPS